MNKKDSYSTFLQISASVIVLICLSGLVFITMYLFVNDAHPLKYESTTIIQYTKNDTVSTPSPDAFLAQLDKRIISLKECNGIIDKKLNEINSFYKLLGSIIAIIIAITGFFGFKSLQELKIQNLEVAEETAKKEAVREVNSELENLRDKTISSINDAKNEAKLSVLSVFYKNENDILVLRENYKDLMQQFSKIDEMDKQITDLQIQLKNGKTTNFKRVIEENEDNAADETNDEEDDGDEFSDNNKP